MKAAKTAIDRLSATLGHLRPNLPTTVRALMLVTFAIGLSQQAPGPTRTAVRRFAPETFHLFVTTM
jgi:hypothetical protein